MTARPTLNNADARRLFLDRHALSDRSEARGLDGLEALIQRLGFVQLDSINTVERAHHMILSARRRSYRPAQLRTLTERRRALFEHWTHDASLIPIAFYPHWRLRFRRAEVRLIERWQKWHRHGFEACLDEVLAHVRANGPTMARDLGNDRPKQAGGWWDWHPEKTALEYHWRTGALAVSGRRGFEKLFDLAEAVIPDEHRAPCPEETETVDWACKAAVERLGFATTGEIAAFWDTATPAEAKAWAAAEPGLIEIDVQGADGRLRRALARPDVIEEAGAAPAPPARLRVLSPFDPALRDRARAERLFGFRYRIEVFVPEAKREYGYYVFPLLEGDRLVGRIDMRRTPQGCLAIRALWPERGVRFGKGRMARLETELDRIARFAGCERIDRAADWLRDPV